MFIHCTNSDIMEKTKSDKRCRHMAFSHHHNWANVQTNKTPNPMRGANVHGFQQPPQLSKCAWGNETLSMVNPISPILITCVKAQIILVAT
jgi:hypothetical protein